MRSKIPKVVGILMIIFASLGLLGGLFGLANAGTTTDLDKYEQFKTFKNIDMIFGVIGLIVSAIHLYGGVRAVGYKANAPGLAKTYGILGIVKAVTYAAIIFAWAKPALEEAVRQAHGDVAAVSAILGVMAVFMTIFGSAWPIIVLALMTRPAAKAACVN